MHSLTTQPAPVRQAPAPPPGLLSSPLFVRVHLALTALLIAALLVVGVLALTGLLHFGKQSAAEVAEAKEKPAETPKETAKEPEKPKEGRFQIDMADESREAVGVSLAGLKVPTREVWVFRYKGGFVQCNLESDSGPPMREFSPNVPPNWKMLRGSKELQSGDPEQTNRQGYVVLMAMPSYVEDEFVAVQPSLGSMFHTGPGGPLPVLTAAFRPIWRRCQYLMFMSARPTAGKEGTGFDYPSQHWLSVHSSYLDYDPPYYRETTSIQGGKDLEAGKEITLLERTRGFSTIRLKARFLTDAEVAEKANE